MWLVLAISSYILQAVNGAIDRVIVHKNKTSPELVSFWISMFSITTMGLLLVGFLPFDFAENFKFVSPSLTMLAAVLVAGIMTQAGLLYMYRALEDGEATRVLSIMGAMTPIVALIFGYFTINETLSGDALLAFTLLILGAIVLTYRSSEIKSYTWIYYALVSATILGIQSIIAKAVYDSYDFISAYALMSFGSVLFGTYLLSKHSLRRELFKSHKKTDPNRPKSSLSLIIINTIIGGVAVIIFNLAIKLGSPSLVNALRGVQYAFVFAIALMLMKRFPMLLDENLTKKTITVKILGIILVISGIVFLST